MQQFEALFTQPSPSMLKYRINVYADSLEAARQSAEHQLSWLYAENPKRFLVTITVIREESV